MICNSACSALHLQLVNFFLKSHNFICIHCQLEDIFFVLETVEMDFGMDQKFKHNHYD